MFLIEKISNSIAVQISSSLKLDKDSEEIIAYGAFAFFQILWSIFLILVFGAAFNVLFESLIVLAAISFLRKYSGGVHSESPNRCAVIGTILSVGFAIIAGKITEYGIVSIIVAFEIACLLIAYVIVLRLAPVDSPAKPIKKPETRKRLKKRSIQMLYCYSLISLMLVVLYYYLDNKNLLVYAVCICIASAWQAFTLTYKGHLIMQRVDTFIGNILIFKGGIKNER